MKLKALVVDDSRVMRKIVKDVLGRANVAEFEFVEAGDGAEALKMFNPEEIDIVFVDWNMPNMTGVDFVREARAGGDADHVPMVMVTSERGMDKMEEALESAGADAYLCKPITEETVQRKLQKVLEGIAEHRKRMEEEQQQEPESGGFFRKLFG